MKSKIIALLGAALCSLFTVNLQAQGTAFTYQGRLNNNGTNATGTYDVMFTLFNTTNVAGPIIAGPVTNTATTVTNGLFTVVINFGSVFNGASNWLELAVRTNGAPGFTTLTPRQQLTPVPYAIFAGTASNLSGTITSGNVAGTYGNAVTLNNAANSFTGSFTGNGASVTNVNAATLGGLTATNFWVVGGNTGANPTNGAFIGTLDNFPMAFRVNSQRVLRLEPNSSQTPSILGGFVLNVVSNGAVGAFIGGGGNIVDGPNRVGGNYGAVLGGAGNLALGDYSSAMGFQNTASGGTSVAMGGLTTASGGNSMAGGFGSTASGSVSTALGVFNVASGTFSTALGNHAQAINDGAFVWGDDSSLNVFASTGNNQFLIRALGGVGINTNNPNGASLAVNGNTTINGNFMGGYPGNVISNGVVGGFIGGGGQASFPNTVGGNFASVLGGAGNTASGATSTAFGDANTASGVGAIAMGSVARASGFDGIAIGVNAVASGNYATAMGYYSAAAHDGAFVWADTLSQTPFSSTAGNQFLVRASGGVGINTNKPNGAALAVHGNTTINGGITVSGVANINSGLTVNGGTTINSSMAVYGNFLSGYTGNVISNNVVNGFIGGGGQLLFGTINVPNTVGGSYAAVLGGAGNTASGSYSVAMGDSTTASGNYSTTMGESTIASGSYSTAMGYYAAAAHNGTFVWADNSSITPFTSTAANQFLVRASGGVGINTGNPGTNALSVNGSARITGGLYGNLGIGTPNPMASIGYPTGWEGLHIVSPTANGLNIIQGASSARLHLRADSNVAGLGQDFVMANSANQVNFLWLGAGLANRVNVMTMATNGNIGIGTSTPANKLEVSGNADFTGTVGIGTTTPTKGALEIDLNSGTQPGYNPVGLLNTSGAFSGSVSGASGVSVWAVGSVFGGNFFAFSDERIKDIQGQSDGAADLKTLLGIKITDYTYKDTIARGSRPQKKVIAQQVEQVYPQAVSKSTDEVPDIYKRATVKDGWIQLATDLKAGDRVKLISDKEKGVYPVLEVREGAFRTDFKPAGDMVFVYGREVNDFRTVDYEAISMLNVSATQELARRVETESAEVAALKQELAETKKLVAQLVRDNQSAKMASTATPQTHAAAEARQPFTTARLDQ